MEAEDGGGGGLCAGELARVDGVDDGARVAQLDAAAHAVAPARPPAKTWACLDMSTHAPRLADLLAWCDCSPL